MVYCWLLASLFLRLFVFVFCFFLIKSACSFFACVCDALPRSIAVVFVCFLSLSLFSVCFLFLGATLFACCSRCLLSVVSGGVFFSFVLGAESSKVAGTGESSTESRGLALVLSRDMYFVRFCV